MLIYNKIIWNNHIKPALTFNPETKTSVLALDEKIRESREKGVEPEYLVLTPSQLGDLAQDVDAQQRFLPEAEVTGIFLYTFRGIPILNLESRKCPLCEKATWKKRNFVFSYDRHYKQILAMNRLAG